MTTKILGIQTSHSFIYDKVEDWKNNCGLPNKHFIDTDSLINLVTECIKHDRKFCKKLRENKIKNKQ